MANAQHLVPAGLPRADHAQHLPPANTEKKTSASPRGEPLPAVPRFFFIRAQQYSALLLCTAGEQP